jgi:hypothetical protein
MKQRDYARLAAALLARDEGKESAAVHRGDRDLGVGSVARAIAERRARKERARRLRLGALTTAGLLVAGFAVFLSGSGDPREVDEKGGFADSPDLIGRSGTHGFPPNSRILAHETPLTVGFVGSKLTLAPHSELFYQSSGGTRHFRLLRGSVHFVVDKLQPSQRLLVETRDTQVTVRGTRFEVGLHPGSSCKFATRVRVTEGVVSVFAGGEHVTLGTGERWPAGCEDVLVPLPLAPAAPLDGPAPEPPRRASDTADSKATAESSSRGKRAPSNAAPRAIELGAIGAQPSDLALQNDLYARAIAARRNGQPREAAALYQELLTRFPRSPLAESAMSERMRMLRSSDRAQAIREARRYLARFPAGSARTEAEALLREP